jgi:hypothetical protein
LVHLNSNPTPIQFVENPIPVEIEQVIDEDLCSLLDQLELKPEIFPDGMNCPTPSSFPFSFLQCLTFSLDIRVDPATVIYTETGELKGATYDQLIIILSDPKAILGIITNIECFIMVFTF